MTYCFACDKDWNLGDLKWNGNAVVCKCPSCDGGLFRSKAEGRRRKWDLRYLALAAHVANWSKDPSTRVGAVLVGANNRIISLGYNGYPRGVDDSPAAYADRTLKLRKMVHAEENAIISAKRELAGATLYSWPFQPCSHCASLIISAEIVRCVAPPLPGDKRERWAADMEIAAADFAAAGVTLDIIAA